MTATATAKMVMATTTTAMTTRYYDKGESNDKCHESDDSKYEY